MKISDKVFKINLVIFIITAIFSIFLLVNFFNPKISIFGVSILTINECGDKFICNSLDLLPFLIFITIILLLAGIIVRKNIKIELLKTIITLIIVLNLGICLLLFSIRGASCGHIAWRSGGSQLFQLAKIQELYRSDHGKYAESYNELFADGYASSSFNFYNQGIISSPVDSDGEGLEGSDNDPNTWSARVYIEVPQYNLCLKISDGYWLVCNQDGCYEEICINGKCNKKSTSDYRTFMKGVSD